MDIADELLRLEVALARRDPAALPDGYEGVLDDAFEEVGRRGRVWTREAMLAALRSDAPSGTTDIVGFSVAQVASEVWLTRYDSLVAGERTRRSSIWIRSGDRLRMRYHQGTPALDRA